MAKRRAFVGVMLSFAVLSTGCVGPFAPHQGGASAAPPAKSAARAKQKGAGATKTPGPKPGGKHSAVAAGGTPGAAASPQPNAGH